MHLLSQTVVEWGMKSCILREEVGNQCARFWWQKWFSMLVSKSVVKAAASLSTGITLLIKKR